MPGTSLVPHSRRIAILIEYDGTDFVGWQVQDNGRSVQAVLESAIKEAFSETSRIVAAGRTDSGVHARGQVAHFDLRHKIAGAKVREALNTRLPADVGIISAAETGATFHARRDARMKTYTYTLSDGGGRPVIDRRKTSTTPFRLDVEAMFDAAQLWLGKHDFTSFRALRCQAESPIRSIASFHVERSHAVAGAVTTLDRAQNAVVFTIRARSFLHHQIRNMVGTLVEIGRGAKPPEWAAEVLAARTRSEAGPTMSPRGLVLESIEYKDTIF